MHSNDKEKVAGTNWKESLSKVKVGAKKFWNFLWNSDSAASWILNIILAFILIKFIVYPFLGIVLGTSFPVVAVVSESMEHGLYEGVICGQTFKEFPNGFDSYWNTCGYWYEDYNITKENFEDFPLHNGFNRGDIIVLWRADSTNTEVGDVIVFQGPKPQPIIHRVVNTWTVENEASELEYFYHTKGDHNKDSFGGDMGELKIGEDRVYGKALFKIPYLGWVKIGFAELIGLIGIEMS